MLNFPSKRIMHIHYSRLIILPKVWLAHHKLLEGGVVDLKLADDGSLIIRPSGETHV